MFHYYNSILSDCFKVLTRSFHKHNTFLWMVYQPAFSFDRIPEIMCEAVSRFPEPHSKVDKLVCAWGTILIKILLFLLRCVLGNTTILAEFASEEEINRFFAQGQSMTASPSWQTLGSSQNRIGSIEGSHPFPNRTDPNHWNGSGDLHGSSLWGVPNYSTSLWGSPSGGEGGGINSPSSISSFLPVDHLTGGGESM